MSANVASLFQAMVEAHRVNTTPGCALWLHSVSLPIHRELYEIVATDAAAGTFLPACETPECGETKDVTHISRTGGPDGYFCADCIKNIDESGREPQQW